MPRPSPLKLTVKALLTLGGDPLMRTCILLLALLLTGCESRDGYFGRVKKPTARHPILFLPDGATAGPSPLTTLCAPN
ncbi:MAG: hypothetical protein NTX51_13455 [Verrucomicrobia bacterium]|nr:hypothetical protein [Verrucomicrobiota bacterium]